MDTGSSSWSELGNYEVVATHDFTPQFVEYIVELYRPFSESDDPKAGNYTPAKMRQYFADGRFAHGFYIVKFKGDVVLAFGVDDFHGWGVVTRYLRFDSEFFIPIGFGVGFPYVLRTQKIKGLCSTQNKDQKDLMGMIVRRYSKHRNEDTLFGAAAQMVSQLRKLDYDVLYRGVVQIAYVYGGDQTPPFQAANTSFKRSAA